MIRSPKWLGYVNGSPNLKPSYVSSRVGPTPNNGPLWDQARSSKVQVREAQPLVSPPLPLLEPTPNLLVGFPGVQLVPIILAFSISIKQTAVVVVPLLVPYLPHPLLIRSLTIHNLFDKDTTISNLNLKSILASLKKIQSIIPINPSSHLVPQVARPVWRNTLTVKT